MATIQSLVGRMQRFRTFSEQGQSLALELPFDAQGAQGGKQGSRHTGNEKIIDLAMTYSKGSKECCTVRL
jgi:hypothetical protein